MLLPHPTPDPQGPLREKRRKGNHSLPHPLEPNYFIKKMYAMLFTSKGVVLKIVQKLKKIIRIYLKDSIYRKKWEGII